MEKIRKKRFWGKLLDAKDGMSSKRFVTLIVTAIFVLTSLDILILSNYVILYSTKGKVEADLLKVLVEIIHWEAMIILGGLGFVTVTSFGNALVEKAKATAEASITASGALNYFNQTTEPNVDEMVGSDEDPKKQ